jgi:hypothetical protein
MMFVPVTTEVAFQLQLMSFWVALTFMLNICSFVRQCNTFTS